MNDKILYDLKKSGLTYDVFLEKYELDKKSVKELIKDLRSKGYNIHDYSVQGEVLYKLETFTSERTAIHLDEVDEDFSFGLISDTHLCAKTCRLNDLLEYYDIIEERGIKNVDHCGDLTDGLDVYHGHASELLYHTIDDQIDFVVNNYPHKKNVTTHYITGNHDLKVLKKVGIDVGNLISSRRSDLHYLGQVLAIIDLAGIKIELCHYKGSMAWSRGYRLQKYLRDYSGTSPDVLALGHKHQMEFVKIMNTYGFEAGCFQGPTTFTKERGLPCLCGGWIVRIVQKDGVIKKIIPEWIGF